jgi:hypothetical protein
MPLTLDGTNGVSAVQAGAVESGDLPAGSVLQVVTVNKTDTFSTTSNSFVTVTGMEASITPSSSSNKVLVMLNFRYGGDDSSDYAARIIRGDGTIISLGDPQNGLSNVYKAHGETIQGFGDYGVTILDEPSTTSTESYTLQVRVAISHTMYVNNRNDGRGNTSSKSSITVMEIAG